MRRFTEALVYACFRVAWTVLRVVPLKSLRAVLEAVGRAVWLIDGRHREVVRANLAIAFPEWSPQRRRAAEREAFGNWGRIVAELVHCDRIAAARGRDDPTIKALRAAAEPVLARGNGLLVLTAHTGNFELLARLWGQSTGGEIAVFHRPIKNPLIDGFLRRERAASGFRVIDRGASVRQALRILARGDVFVVPLDQNQPAGRGIFVEMFGCPASTTTLLARLSLASRAPVMPVFAAWEGDLTTAVIGEPIDDLAGGERLRGSERERAIRALTAEYTARIEKVVRAYPEQWNWAHRRWKTRPPRSRTSTRGGRIGSDSV